MKFLKVLGILILLIAVGVGIWLATLPDSYAVSRTIEVEAPASVVYELVVDFNNWIHWSPWEKYDPNMEKSISGSGEGAVYSWSGNDSVGTGSITVVEAIPYTAINNKLKFTSPWESESSNTWRFEEKNNVTTVIWTDSSDLPFFQRFMGSMMDDVMGPDFERGLASLKSKSENQYAEIQQQEAERLRIESDTLVMEENMPLE